MQRWQEKDEMGMLCKACSVHVYMLQVKIQFRLENFLMLSDSCLVTLIHEQLGQGDSKLKGTEIENKPKNHKML